MKMFMITLSLAISSATVVAQKHSLQVPAAVKSAFSTAHPQTTGTWEREDGNYEVNFTEGGKEMSCVIDKTGTIQETETVIAVSKLPAPAREYIAQHYKSATVKDAAHLVKGNGETMYEAVIAGKDLLFREDGRFIKADKE